VLIGFAVLTGLIAPVASAAEGEALPMPRLPGSLQTRLVEAVMRPTGLASYGGWVAWSRYDPVHRGYELMTSNPAGLVAPVSVAENSEEFEVGLGPLRSGAVGAIFARCKNAARAQGCNLEEIEIGSGIPHEKRLLVPGGGSLFRPALWKGRIAFLRAVPHGGYRHPVEMFEWTSGSKRLRALALPRNKIPRESLESSSRSFDGYTGEITGLTLNGTRVAYTRVAPYLECCTVSDLWVQRPGQQPKLIDSTGTGGGAAYGTRTYLSPTIVGPWLYSYRQYHEPGLADGEPAWVRFNLTSSATQQARVAFGEHEEFGGGAEGEGDLEAVLPRQGGVAWVLRDRGTRSERAAFVLSLPAVKWRTIKRREGCSGPHKRRSDCH